MTIPDSGRPSDFFDAAYRETPPWDIGAPQPAILALLDEYPPTGPVLDVGCGTGVLALALAQRGLSVLGVDLAQAAIVQARARAAAAAPEVARLLEFRMGNALQPASFTEPFGSGPFGAVVDTGFFHLFGPSERERFAQDLAPALANGGRYYLLGFAMDSPFPNAPQPVRESTLRTLFAPERGWRILTLRPAHFVTRTARGDVPALAMCVERVHPAQARPLDASPKESGT